MPRIPRAQLRAQARAALAIAGGTAPSSPPARAPRAPRVAGTARARPCLGCLKSALAGKEGVGPLCQDVVGAAPGARCFRCSSGHSCVPIPKKVVAAATKFLSATTKKAKNEWRPVVKGLLKLPDDDDEDLSALSAAEKKERALAAARLIVELAFA